MSQTARSAPAAAESQTCPSARCEPGATLLGIVEADGRVAPLRTRLVIDEAFVAKAAQGRSPESRFRFASRCVEGGCQQWTGCGCGVIDRAMAALEGDLEAAVQPESLPPCLIRTTCRWYRQRQAAACKVCTYVVTDTTR